MITQTSCRVCNNPVVRLDSIVDRANVPWVGSELRHTDTLTKTVEGQANGILLITKMIDFSLQTYLRDAGCLHIIEIKIFRRSRSVDGIREDTRAPIV
jgi:hypothetical protein